MVHSEARKRFDDIDKPEPSNTWVTTVVFSIKPRKNDDWAGNCFGSVRSSFVTLLSALCAFSQGSNLGFHVAQKSLLIFKYCVCLFVCLSVDSAFFGKHFVREGKI